MNPPPIAKTDTPANRPLNAAQAGQYSSFSARSIWTFCKRGLIRHAKVPSQSRGGYRFGRQWLDELLESPTVAAKTDSTTVQAARDAATLRPAADRRSVAGPF